MLARSKMDCHISYMDMSREQAELQTTESSPARGVSFLWIEVTHKCNLECVHCYTESSPKAPHGSMLVAHWKAVLADAARLGVSRIQFIGGEPLIYKGIEDLIGFAHDVGLGVEVYSNLTAVSERQWRCFVDHEVRLATSVYESRDKLHDAVTGRPGSHTTTMRNIARARSLGLAVRAGFVQVHADQDAASTVTFLGEIGVKNVKVDRMRRIGRPSSGDRWPVSELCGACTRAVAA